MDGYMEEFIAEPFVTEEIDLDYEFDAARFCDFTRPETDLEALEVERWFESAPTCPPSPLIVKLKWLDIPVENRSPYNKPINDEKRDSTGNDSDSYMGSEVSAIDDTSKGCFFEMAQASPKSKTKSPVKSTLARSSTLMKPTASHLAKQNKPGEIHSTRFFRRFQKKLENIDERSSRSAYMLECQATKRQKLEAGFIQKVAHLKHPAVLLHKLPKNVGTIDVNSVCRRPGVTIPREPNLATAHRAQIHRSKINAELDQLAKSNARTFKARPLNRKILEAPSSTLPKKHITELQEIQVFCLKDLRKAMQHISSDEICKTANKVKPLPLYTKEFNLLTDRRFPDEPPIELFSKLSIATDSHPNGKPQSKMSLPTRVAKENRQAHYIKHLKDWVRST